MNNDFTLLVYYYYYYYYYYYFVICCIVSVLKTWLAHQFSPFSIDTHALPPHLSRLSLAKVSLNEELSSSLSEYSIPIFHLLGVIFPSSYICFWVSMQDSRDCRAIPHMYHISSYVLRFYHFPSSKRFWVSQFPNFLLIRLGDLTWRSQLGN